MQRFHRLRWLAPYCHALSACRSCLHRRRSFDDSRFRSESSKLSDGLRIRVVPSRIRRTIPKHEFCTLLTVLMRARRGHDAKVSKRIERVGFLVFQRCGNAPFCAERPDQLKFLRFEGGDDPNRPSRFEWTAKIRKPFVLSGPSPQKSGLVEV